MTSSKSSLILIAILITASIFPRIWNLTTFPQPVVDEPANIRDIDLVIHKNASILDFHWDFSKSKLVHFLPILLIRFGIEDKFFALRLSSVIISLLSLIPFFLIARKLSNNVISFCLTMLFSFSFYFLQFSRVGWTDVILNIFLGLTLFNLIIDIKDNHEIKVLKVVLAGIITSLIFYSYRSGIIIIFTSMLFLLLTKKPILSLAKIILIYSATFLIFSFPWINKILSEPNKYNLRLNVVSINNITFPFGGFRNKNEMIVSQTQKTVDSWILLNNQFIQGEESPRYLPQGFRIVNPLVKFGFWVGLITGLFYLKQVYPLYVILILGMVGQVMTLNPPNGARGLVMLPCIYLTSVVGFYKLYELFKKPKLYLLILVVLSVLFSIQDFEFYKYWVS